MLVLGRKAGEEVYIGPDIRITIVKVDGGTVRLGIEAPRELRVDRAEISPIKKPRRLVGTTNKPKLRRAA